MTATPASDRKRPQGENRRPQVTATTRKRPQGENRRPQELMDARKYNLYYIIKFLYIESVLFTCKNIEV